jgi:NADPH-dependent curcumin reductase CurA
MRNSHDSHEGHTGTNSGPWVIVLVVLLLALLVVPVLSALGLVGFFTLSQVEVAPAELSANGATATLTSNGVTIDHRQSDLPERLKITCPNGIDIYFENVGGPLSEAVLPLLNNYARVPVCGLIAQYNATELPAGPNRVPTVMQTILVKRLTFRGFIVWDFAAHYPDFLRDITGWLREGRVKYREDITDGLENAPRELIGLLKGENFGKKIIRISADPKPR